MRPRVMQTWWRKSCSKWKRRCPQAALAKMSTRKVSTRLPPRFFKSIMTIASLCLEAAGVLAPVLQRMLMKKPPYPSAPPKVLTRSETVHGIQRGQRSKTFRRNGRLSGNTLGKVGLPWPVHPDSKPTPFPIPNPVSFLNVGFLGISHIPRGLAQVQCLGQSVP